jgi:heat shock protein HslJ
MLLGLCALPTSAQDATTNTVSFNSFSFSFPNTLATNVNIAQVAADDPALEQPGGPNVKHSEFTLFNGAYEPESGFLGEGIVSIYNSADFAGYELATTEYTNLQNLLAERPDLSSYMVPSDGTNASSLPYLPVVGASQVIRAQAQYIDTDSLQGVSYVTAYRQDVSPFTSNGFLYIFQGLSSDGGYYVSVVIFLDMSLFPAEIPTDFDYDAFSEDYMGYLTETITTLTNATPNDFSPSLTTLNQLVQTISFSGTTPTPSPDIAATTIPATPAATETTSGDPLMGGLAGKTWTLTSYGSPDAPQTPIEGSTITAVFSEDGVSGSAGCNSYSASFTFDNSTLTVGEAIRTLMACEEALMTQEDAYLAALATAGTYTITDNQLQINYADGVLTFTGA